MHCCSTDDCCILVDRLRWLTVHGQKCSWKVLRAVSWQQTWWTSSSTSERPSHQSASESSQWALASESVGSFIYSKLFFLSTSVLLYDFERLKKNSQNICFQTNVQCLLTDGFLHLFPMNCVLGLIVWSLVLLRGTLYWIVSVIQQWVWTGVEKTT